MAVQPSRGMTPFLASFVPAMVLMAIGFVIIGGSAPFWQLLVVAVAAGLAGRLLGWLYIRGKAGL